MAPGRPGGRPLDLPDADATRPATATATGGGAHTAEQPAAQRPQQARQAGPTIQRRPPTRRLEPGDLICAECGEGNPATRKFCSRCGTSLAEATAVTRKWWQKLMPHKGPKKRKAGDRPSARKTRKSFPSKIMGIFFGGASKVVGVILLIGGILYGIIPNVRSSVNDFVSSTENSVKNKISPNLVAVQPVPQEVTASNAVKGHPGLYAVDDIKNDFWLAKPVPAPVLTVRFPSPIKLDKIIVRNGPSGTNVNYQQYSRPASLHFVFDTDKSTNITLKDDPDPHTYDVANGSGITTIRISFNSTVPGTRPQIALTEIEFRAEK